MRFGLEGMWPDEGTRSLLEERAVQDDEPSIRGFVIGALADQWPDERTRALLRQRAVKDADDQTRGSAFSALGRLHSRFGRFVTTRDLDGAGPYLDPLEPIPREHIDQAPNEAGIPPEEIDNQVKSLSAYVGWDITRGAKPPGQAKASFKQTEKNRKTDP